MNFLQLIKKAFQNINQYKILYFYSLSIFLISFIGFFVLAQFSQVLQIFNLEVSIIKKLSIFFIFLLEFLNTISSSIFILSFFYFLALYLVILTSFSIFFIKKKRFQKNASNKNFEVINNKNSLLSFFSFIFSFLGFGCVACGQAIIFSILTFIFGTISLTFAYTVSYALLILGSLLLVIVLRKNIKILAFPDMCLF